MLPPLRTGRATSLCRTIPFNNNRLLAALPPEELGSRHLRGSDVQDKVDQPIPSPRGGLDERQENGSEEVLKIYTTTVKFSLEEHQAAFDAAVSTYRARNQDVSEKAARRMVERIICNNL